MFSVLDRIICIPTPQRGCDQWQSLLIENFVDRQYTVEQCYGLCQENADCGGFFINRVDISSAKKGSCMLYRAGCTGKNLDLDYYAMTNCSASGMLSLNLPCSEIRILLTLMYLKYINI